MIFYRSLLYFEKRIFWSIIALVSSIFFTICSFTIAYFVFLSTDHFTQDMIISESNNNEIIEYESNLKNGLIKHVTFNEVSPNNYSVTYYIDTEKEIKKRIQDRANANENDIISDTESELIEKFSTKNFKIMKSSFKKPEDTSYEVVEFNDYYFNKVFPFFIVGAFFFCSFAISSFMKDRVIYKEQAKFDSI